MQPVDEVRLSNRPECDSGIYGANLHVAPDCSLLHRDHLNVEKE